MMRGWYSLSSSPQVFVPPVQNYPVPPAADEPLDTPTNRDGVGGTVWTEIRRSMLFRAFTTSTALLIGSPLIYIFSDNIITTLYFGSLLVFAPFWVVGLLSMLRLALDGLVEIKRALVSYIEVATSRDLDGDGQVGSPVSILDTEEGEELAYSRLISHFLEFARRARAVGIARRLWFESDGAPFTFRFSDGSLITRPEYEAYLVFLNVRGRRKGRTGELVEEGENGNEA